MQDRYRTRVREAVDIRVQFPPPPPEQASLARKQAPGDSHSNSPGEQKPADQEFQVEGVYVISVAARILEMHPQTLRKYERLGLINPARTVGMLRLYSQDDIRRIKLIRHLTDNLGLNLNGVVFALTLVENLLGFWERTAPLPDDDPAKAMVEKEILQLFRNLNLPLEQ